MRRNSFIAVIPCVLIGCGELQPLIEGTGSESGESSESEGGMPGTESGETDDGSEPMCGDGIVNDEAEECDDGDNNNDQGACKTDCTMQACGDGHVGLAEGCDDGNRESGDGCSEACLSENCGDEVVNGDEECDDGNSDDTDACTSLCKNAVCGDAFVHEGEEACDDGNSDDTDACTNACNDAVCGDSIVQEGVEDCDDGDNMDDTDDCVTGCKAAFCGDGFLQVGVEECDDANDNNDDDCVQGCKPAFCGDGFLWAGVETCDDGDDDNTDACVGMCVPATCGDGFVQANVEQCDDGNMIELDGCTSDCVPPNVDVRRVFVTSTLHTGNLGGLAGADMICNTRAQAANLPGTYMAWISTNVDMMMPVTPANRFTHALVPYVLVDGTDVADNWADLIDGTLDNPIALTESGEYAPETTLNCNGARVVRTGTAPDGTLGMGIGRCNNFTQAGNGALGTIGRATSTVGEWSQCGDLQPCTALLPIYCFEQ